MPPIPTGWRRREGVGGDGEGGFRQRRRMDLQSVQGPLEIQKVRLQYSRTIFALHLPACPRCGMILIAEELATGKMAEAEQALEDK